MTHTDVLIARFIELARQRLMHRPPIFKAFELEVKHGPDLGKERRGMAAQYWPLKLDYIAGNCEPGCLDADLISEIDSWAKAFSGEPLADVFCDKSEAVLPVADGNESNLGTSGIEKWQLNKPQRMDTLLALIYKEMKRAKDAGESKPKARDVMDAIASSGNADYVGMVGGELKYYDSNGDVQAADAEAIRKRIDRLTGR